MFQSLNCCVSFSQSRVFRIVISAVFCGLFLCVVPRAQSFAKEITPGSDWCGVINSSTEDHELILRPGEYRGSCAIRRGGSEGRPLLIRSSDFLRPARITYEGRSANVLDIKADHVILRGLEFGPSQPDVDGVRIYSQRDITIEDCKFSALGGIAIVANHSSVHGLVVRRNIVTDSTATAMYFGCHDGHECAVSNLLIESNYINRVEAPEPLVGYGVQIKLNSIAVIRDNMIIDTKGPGIMVYGTSNSNGKSIIERNFVSGSRKSSGIVLGGGPVLVRNNIVSHNFEGGITLQDYGNRGLLKNIILANNTSFKNVNGEFVLPLPANLSDVLFVNNAVAATDGNRALPRPQSGLKLQQNVDCTTIACFADPAGLNFSPLPSSRLTRSGNAKDAALPTDDYFGRSRNGSATAGAIAFPAAPIKLGIKVD